VPVSGDAGATSRGGRERKIVGLLLPVSTGFGAAARFRDAGDCCGTSVGGLTRKIFGPVAGGVGVRGCDGAVSEGFGAREVTALRSGMRGSAGFSRKLGSLVATCNSPAGSASSGVRPPVCAD
jgi:hypothetical protein